MLFDSKKRNRLIFSIALIILYVFLLPSIANAAEEKANVNSKVWLCIGILLIAAILFLTEIIPLSMTSLLVPVLLILLHVVDYKSAFSGFSNDIVLLFLMMFIIGGAIFRTGIAEKVGQWIVHFAGGSEIMLILYIMLAGGLMSSFLSKTGTSACLLPIIIAVARTKNVSPRILLIPMAFGVDFGGNNTLIGTPPNGIIQDALIKATGGQLQYGFFSFAKVGLPVMAVGIIYMMTIGRRILEGIGKRPESGNYVKIDSKPESGYRTEKALLVVIIFVAIIFFMVMDPLWGKIFKNYPAVGKYFKDIPLAAYAMAGVIILISTRTLRPHEAFAAVDWSTIFLFAGMMSLSVALEKTGAATLIANGIASITKGSHYASFAGLTITAMLVTNFMSNTAATALFAPIAVSLSQTLGVNPWTMLMGIGIGTSVTFLTPVATPPNTIVVGPGDYRFTDFLKVGILLEIIVGTILLVLIPIFFPF